jgi:hypothetical protein
MMTYRYKAKDDDVRVRGLLLKASEWRVSNIRLPFTPEEEAQMVIETSEDGTFADVVTSKKTSTEEKTEVSEPANEVSIESSDSEEDEIPQTEADEE